MSILPEYATVQEAADYLGIHPDSGGEPGCRLHNYGIDLGKQLVIKWPHLEALKQRGYDGRVGRPSHKDKKPGETNVRFR